MPGISLLFKDRHPVGSGSSAAEIGRYDKERKNDTDTPLIRHERVEVTVSILNFLSVKQLNNAYG